PSLANGYLSYVATPGGNIAHDRDFGSQRNTGEVVRAALTAGGIDLVVFFPASAQSRQITLAKTADGRLRIITDALITTNESPLPTTKASAAGAGRRLSAGPDWPGQMRCG